ncbi:MAG: DUF507 family protein [Candidatus Binatia bacterium]
MARLSDDRISDLARRVLVASRSAGEIRDERRALLEAKRVLAESFQLEDRLDPVVRSRIPRRVIPGSEEWNILYRRYMEEELRKVRGK